MTKDTVHAAVLSDIIIIRMSDRDLCCGAYEVHVMHCFLGRKDVVG